MVAPYVVMDGVMVKKPMKVAQQIVMNPGGGLGLILNVVIQYA